MSVNKHFALLKTRKDHPFLVLCLSMAAVGIAAELIYATSGRFSAVGDSVLLMIPVGIMVYGALEHFSPSFCFLHRNLAPLLLLLYSIGMLAIGKAPFSLPMAALFGVLIGLFICASLVSFLESGPIKNLGLKAGVSASLYSVAVFPLSMGHRYFSNLFSKVSITNLGFMILIVFLLVVFFLWPESDENKAATESAKARLSAPRYLNILLIGFVTLIALGQVMNSGTLEMQGGLAGIPWLYFAIIALRVPFAALLGYWIDKRLSVLNMAVPIALMVLGCLAAQFLDSTFAGNAMIYLVLNLGEKGCVFLVCILCVMTAARRPRKGFIAGLGLLIYFASEGLFNLHMLGISQAYFDQQWESLLTPMIVFVALLVFIFLLVLATRSQNSLPEEDGSHSEQSQEWLRGFADKYRLTTRESDVVRLASERKSPKEIAKELFINVHSVQNVLSSIYQKTGVKGRDELRILISRERPLR